MGGGGTEGEASERLSALEPPPHAEGPTAEEVMPRSARDPGRPHNEVARQAGNPNTRMELNATGATSST